MATASLAITSPLAISPAAVTTFVGAAPVLASVQYFGPGDPTQQPLGLQVDAEEGGRAGQVLALQLLAGDRVIATSAGATATHANLPLTHALDPSLSWSIQARWSGAGVTATTYGGWCERVSVLSATTAIFKAEYDADTLAVVTAPEGSAWVQGVYAYAKRRSDGWMTGAAFIGTRGSFPLTAGADLWDVAARPYQSSLPAAPAARWRRVRRSSRCSPPRRA